MIHSCLAFFSTDGTGGIAWGLAGSNESAASQILSVDGSRYNSHFGGADSAMVSMLLSTFIADENSLVGCLRVRLRIPPLVHMQLHSLDSVPRWRCLGVFQ